MTVALVTGGSGFLGRHLANRLVAVGQRVHTLSRRPAFGRAMVSGTEHHVLDLADEQGLDELLSVVRPDVVYHLGTTSRMPPRATDAEQARIGLDDVDNLLTLLSKASAHPPRILIRAGTIAEYGSSRTPSTEDGPQAPENPYGVAALAATQLMRNMAPSLPFQAVTARLALLYGPGQSHRFLLPQLVASCAARERLRIDRPGDIRDWLHVEDAVEALIRIADAPDCPRVVNIATGIGTSARDAAGMVAGAAGARHLIDYGQSQRPPVSLLASPELARRTLHWQARTTIAEGLAQLVERARMPKASLDRLKLSMRGLSA